MTHAKKTIRQLLLASAAGAVALGTAATAFAQTTSATELLVNGGFEQDVRPNYGNNVNSPTTGWTVTSGRPNLVRVDGPGGQAAWYTNAPASDASNSPAGVDRQYLDGQGYIRMFQTFQSNCTGPVRIEGSFSGREGGGRGSFRVFRGTQPSGAPLSSQVSVSVPSHREGGGQWRTGSTTVNVTQGESYTLAVEFPDRLNFDEASAMTQRGCQVPVPRLPVPDGEHFQCYMLRKGDKLKREEILVRDQFGENKVVLATPAMLCNPAEKVHDGKTFKMKDKERHLVCYTYEKRPDVRSQALEVGTQFGYDEVSSARAELFCAPASKRHLGR